MEKYILVSWPEIQDFMNNPRWSECKFCIETEGHPCGDSTYMVPEDLYDEVYNIEEYNTKFKSRPFNVFSFNGDVLFTGSYTECLNFIDKNPSLNLTKENIERE